MDPVNHPTESPPTTDTSADVQDAVKRLHRIRVYGRWAGVAVLWLTVGLVSLWGLRYPISLILDHFTWAAVRYGMIFHPVPAIGVSVCLGMTLGVLIRQGRDRLLGMPQREQKRLAQQVCRIRQQGSSHPLWKVVCPR